MGSLIVDHANIVKRAASVLVRMYKEAALELRHALRECDGVDVRNREPYGVFYEPYAVEQGVAGMREKVRESGLLLVSLLNSGTATYGIEGNAWFRYVHDMGHLLFWLDFNERDESALHILLWGRLERTDSFRGLSKMDQELVRLVYDADTKGQTEYFAKHGKFPADQTAFCVEYLRERV